MALKFMDSFLPVQSPTGEKYKLKNEVLGILNTELNEHNEYAEFSSGTKVLSSMPNMGSEMKRLSFFYAFGALSTRKTGFIDDFNTTQFDKIEVTQKQIIVDQPGYYANKAHAVDIMVDEEIQSEIMGKLQEYIPTENLALHQKVWTFLKTKATSGTLSATLTNTPLEIGASIAKFAREKLTDSVIPEFKTIKPSESSVVIRVGSEIFSKLNYTGQHQVEITNNNGKFVIGTSLQSVMIEGFKIVKSKTMPSNDWAIGLNNSFAYPSFFYRSTYDIGTHSGNAYVSLLFLTADENSDLIAHPKAIYYGTMANSRQEIVESETQAE